MIQPVFRTFFWGLLTTVVCSGSKAADADGPWTPLFDGKTLTGWHNPFDWGQAKVVDGEIHLTADQKFFLVTDQQYANFVVEADVRIPEGKANSGIMFRCHAEKNHVFGYQAEVDGSDRRWSGGLYDEQRRSWLWPSKTGRTQFPAALGYESRSQAWFATREIRNALRRRDWNTYRVTCRGRRLRIEVNGVLTTDYEDPMDARGYIALQHHGENGQTYRFRNVRIQELPDDAKPDSAVPAHGGQVIEFSGAPSRHARMLFDPDSRQISLYFCSTESGQPHPATDVVFELEDGEDEVHLEVTADPLEGESAESCSRWVIAGSEVSENTTSLAQLDGHFHVTLDGNDVIGRFGPGH